jgi:hypothetical protein
MGTMRFTRVDTMGAIRGPGSISKNIMGTRSTSLLGTMVTIRLGDLVPLNPMVSKSAGPLAGPRSRVGTGPLPQLRQDGQVGAADEVLVLALLPALIAGREPATVDQAPDRGDRQAGRDRCLGDRQFLVPKRFMGARGIMSTKRTMRIMVFKVSRIFLNTMVPMAPLVFMATKGIKGSRVLLNTMVLLALLVFMAARKA